MADAPEESHSRSAWHWWNRNVTSNGIPLGDLGPVCDDPTLRYSRVMYSKGYGLAPWTPLSALSTQSWPRNGVMIGDVGYLDVNKGTFRHLFNIFHDPKRTDDTTRRLPDNFVPIEPPFADWEVNIIQDYFPNASVISSEGVEVTRTSADTLNFTVSCNVTEGGVLVLPKGGSREDMVIKDSIYDYVSTQALEWFQFADGYNKNKRTVTIPNGSLYLVTGVDKVPEWSVLSFWQEGKQLDRESPTVTYRYGSTRPWTNPKSDTYKIWSNHCPQEVHDGRLATAFVRGLRIAISPSAWEEYLPTEISEPIYNIPVTSLSIPSTVTAGSFVRSLRKIRPDIVQKAVFHPSFIVIQMMLCQVPKKKWPKLIVVDDAIWCPWVEGKYLNWDTTVSLVAHIFKMNHIIHRDGVMYLAPKPADGSVAQAESILQRLLSYLGEDIQRRAEVYLTTRAIKKAVKLVVFEQSDNE